MSGNSRSRPSPRMKASASLSRIMEMDFSFPSSSQIVEMDFFILFPFLNYGIGFFYSQIVGMFFFHSLPVLELWEWFFFIPFPFPNYGNVFFSFPSRSRIVGIDFFNSLPIPEFENRNQNGNWITVRDTRPPIFSASSTFLKTIILRR